MCVSADEQQARIDALLAAYPPVTVTTAPTVSTVYETTTVQADPLPAVTVTTPAVTVASPPVEHTVTETVTQTVTVPQVVTVAAENIAPDPDWLVALGVRSAALNLVFGLA